MTPRRPFLLLALLFLPFFAASADAGHRGRWTALQRYETCIGGQRCGPYALELPLSGAPVEAVRFYAHDDVGDKHKARLRVAIDGHVIARGVDVKAAGRGHEIAAYGQPGRYLVIVVENNDEAVIEDVEVLYRGHRGRRHRPSGPWHGGGGWQSGGGGGWQSCGAGGCFGGEICRQGGDALVLPLSGAPVRAIRFYAHDAVGDKTGGRLRISIDGHVIAYDLDVKRDGRLHEIDARGLIGRRLVFEAIRHDEVVVQDVEVLYRY